MDIDSGPATGRRKSISFNPLTRSNSGSMYPVERPDKLPGSEYRKDISRRPAQVYGEPVEEFKNELWSNGTNLFEAKQEMRNEGGPRYHLISDPYFYQSLDNSVINANLNMEAMEYKNRGYDWRNIAKIFLSRLNDVLYRGSAEDRRDYQVVYFKLLSLIKSGLLRDEKHDIEPSLVRAIDVLGGYERVGRARRKTRGRKKLRKTRRKSKQ